MRGDSHERVLDSYFPTVSLSGMVLTIKVPAVMFI
jgi:hypothetical protein